MSHTDAQRLEHEPLPWKRVRPGLYRADLAPTIGRAEIERGAETGTWYWTVMLWDATHCGRSYTLKAAKASVNLWELMR